MQNEIQVTGAKGYLIWLAQNQPDLYKQVREKLRPMLPKDLGAYMRGTLGGLGVDSQVQLQTIGVDLSLLKDPVIAAAPQGASSTWSDTLANVLQGVAVAYSTKQQIDAQAKLNQIQLDRIRQGLQPMNIDPASLGLQTASASIGIAPNTQKMLMWGGGAILGVWILTSVLGGRRARA
jgi:hypothetical protein